MKCSCLLSPRLVNWLAGFAILVGLFPIAGWIGGSFWFFDLFNHFQLQYAAFLLVALIVVLWRKAWRCAALIGALLLVPLIRLAPCWIVPEEQLASTGLRFATFNVLAENTRYADAVSWIRETDPDVAFFPEAGETWAKGLKPLSAAYPYSVEHPVKGYFGFVFYSKFPILEREIVPCGKRRLAYLKVRLQGPAGVMTFYGVHPNPPGGAERTQERDIYLKAIADDMAKETGSVVLAGDFNATPWSNAMKPLYAAGLRGRHASPTWWESKLPMFAIPIDFVLYRGPLDQPERGGLKRRWIGPDLGSDHRPLVSEIAW